MKTFINRFIGFAILPVVLLCSLLAVNKYLADFRIDSSKHILVMGHSHPECAINDSIIKGVGNYAQSGESYFYNYFKTKKIIDHNPQIDYVLIEFSNSQIGWQMDDWIWGEMYMAKRFPRYALFMELQELGWLFRRNSSCFKRSLVPILKNSIRMPFKGFQYTENKIGGYFYLERDKTEWQLAHLSEEAETVDTSSQLSEVNLAYLDKTIDYCQKKGVKVVLIRCPIHKRSLALQNEALFQWVRNNRYAAIEFLDFSQFPLSNSEFGDLDHLNYKGARRFSQWFASALGNGLLQKADKQQFIDEQITDAFQLD